MALMTVLLTFPVAYGNYNELVQEVAAEQGQSLITWNLDSGDTIGATLKQSEEIYDNAVHHTDVSIIALNSEAIKSTA